MIIDEIVDFTYSRNKVWQGLITKEQLKAFFKELCDTTVVIRNERKTIVAVAVYTLRNSYPVFVSLTIDEGLNGYKIIREFMRNLSYDKIHWLNKNMEFKKCLQ